MHHWTNAAFRVTCLTLNIQCVYTFLARNNFIAQFLCINEKCIINELSYLISGYISLLESYILWDIIKLQRNGPHLFPNEFWGNVKLIRVSEYYLPIMP